MTNKSIEFEDTTLPDTPVTRRAFLFAKVDDNLESMNKAGRVDDGSTPASLKLKMRLVELLQQHVPNPDPELLAAGLMFLSFSFSRGGAYLIRHPSNADTPQLRGWVQEFQDIQCGADIRFASTGIQQIMLAANTAILEFRNGLHKLMSPELQRNLYEKDCMERDIEDCGAPGLNAAYKAARNEVAQDQSFHPVTRALAPSFLR
jgi:hypothetical protein